MKALLIKKWNGKADYFEYYVDHERQRYWYVGGHMRKAIFRCLETHKVLKGYIYPLYSFMKEGKKFFIKEVTKP